MKVSFSCNDCGTRYTAFPEQAGKKGTCKNCGSEIEVPTQETNKDFNKSDARVPLSSTETYTSKKTKGYVSSTVLPFAEAMARRSDAELVEILTQRHDDYQPDTLAAAEMELEKRNLTTEQVEQAKQSVELKIQQRANEPLEAGWKLLTFLIPGIITSMIAATLKADGYDGKFREARRWMFYGFGFYLSLGLLTRLGSC